MKKKIWKIIIKKLSLMEEFWFCNNIITINEYNYLKQLRYLIRIFCFQEELQNLFFESWNFK